MTNFRPIFENDWCGIEVFLKDVLSPVFGDYEQGYDVLTNVGIHDTIWYICPEGGF